MSIVREWHPDRPHCLPGCNRLDGHDGRDSGACMGPGGEVLRGVYTYDGPLGFPPDTVVVYGGTPFPETVTPPWTPFRNGIPRVTALEAEERDRREWIAGVKRRLGLITR